MCLIQATRLYQCRAVYYAQWHDALGSRTRFFEAASLTNWVLAHLTQVCRAFSILTTALGWLAVLGTTLQRTNAALAGAMMRGELDDPRLDTRMVSMEQTIVEHCLRRTQGRELCTTLRSELNTLLNKMPLLAPLHMSASVRCYGRVLADVRAGLGVPLRFDCRRHREQIGLSLIQELAARPHPEKIMLTGQLLRPQKAIAAPRLVRWPPSFASA